MFWQFMEEFVAVLRAVSRQGVQWGACCDLYHVHVCLKKLRNVMCFAASDCVVAGAGLTCSQSVLSSVLTLYSTMWDY